MNKFERNSACVIGFVAFIALLIIGGNYLVKNFNKEDDDSTPKENEVLYIDSNKDIVYYENVNVISEDANLIYRDIRINLNSEDAKKVEKTLNDDMDNIRDSYKLISESDIDKNLIVKDYDDLLEANIIDYTVYDSTKYLTILVNNYMFYATEEENDGNLTYYVFDKYSGKLLNNQLICENEHLTNEEIENKIYEYLSTDETIDVDETLANGYTLYYNEYGDVMAKILVNIEDITYNDFVKVV